MKVSNKNSRYNGELVSAQVARVVEIETLSVGQHVVVESQI